MNIPRTNGWDRETALVSQLAAAASLLAFLFYFRHGDLLLYGDAVAHINIARRVIDSRMPGPLQLGTVWLPLPHLLMIPFLLSNAAWQTGVAGSIPSMCAYVFGVTGMFRLVRGGLSDEAQSEAPARMEAWLAAAIYAANPNLLYMQSTAMTEVLYLALFIWTVVHFREFVQNVRSEKTDDAGRLGSSESLMRCGWCLFASCLTRYDGWFLAGAVCLASLSVTVKYKPELPRHSLAKFIIWAMAGPILWLGYNAIIYHNPLEFANGPYSARAIEQQKTALSDSSPHPGWHSLPVSVGYFLKSAEENVAQGRLLQRLWLILAVAGVIIVVALGRQLWALLLLGLPSVFYASSIAYGSVPIYLPDWWPFSYYNVRFGLELLPAFSALFAVTLFFLLARVQGRYAKGAIVAGALILVTASYGLVWKAEPICYREAWTNSRSRIALETALAGTLIKLPHDSTLLMYTGDHGGALQDAGIPLRRTINEGDHRPWKKSYDPEGLWERALADPQKYVDYVVAIDDDPVAKEVQRRDLTSMVVIRTIGQAPATIYWTHRLER
jgi:hypothetical protein